MHPSAFSPLLYAQIVLLENLQVPLWVRIICARNETHLYCLFCIAFCWERSLAEVIESLCAVYGKDYVEKSRWKLIYKALTGSLDLNRALRRVLLFGSIEDRCMRNDSPQTTVDRLKKTTVTETTMRYTQIWACRVAIYWSRTSKRDVWWLFSKISPVFQYRTIIIDSFLSRIVTGNDDVTVSTSKKTGLGGPGREGTAQDLAA